MEHQVFDTIYEFFEGGIAFKAVVAALGRGATAVYISTFGIVNRKRKVEVAQSKEVEDKALRQAFEDSRKSCNIKFIARSSRNSVEVHATAVAYFEFVL
ncbi:hypothetical protein HMPREF9073_00726 [Capnocytophaga sp. oral taxon 326 str. F0382]|nr:hypothetical protein HMPREF9073_00726 [Capnocytophaga sp. oral taxon 326 str. F0382]